MSNEIIKVLDNLAKKFGVAIDWSSQNVAPYIQELMDKYVSCELWTSVAMLIMAVGAIVCVLIGYNRLKQTELEIWVGDYSSPFFTPIIASSVIIIFVPTVVCQVLDIITCLTCPEKMMFEYVVRLLQC